MEGKAGYPATQDGGARPNRNRNLLVAASRYGAAEPIAWIVARSKGPGYRV